MDLGDSLGLIPFNFEPQLSSEELVLLSSVDDMTVEETVPHSAVGDWCSCNNCEEMKSDECVCCKASDLTVGNLDDNECITEHTHFEQIVLNPVILEVASIQIHHPQKFVTDRSKVIVVLWFSVVCFGGQNFGDA